MEFLATSGLLFPLGIALAFWVLTSKKFRKETGAEVSYFVSENLGGMSDSAHRANVTALQEFKMELKEEFGISLEDADKEFESYRRRRRGVTTPSTTKGKSNGDI